MARRPHSPVPAKDHAKLIDQLGGPSEVARIVSKHIGREDDPIVPQAACQWKKRGIPFAYRACLAIKAREKGVSVPPGFLGEQAQA